VFTVLYQRNMYIFFTLIFVCYGFRVFTQECGYCTSDDKWGVLIITLGKILNSFSVGQSNCKRYVHCTGSFEFFILMPLV
jgi:hypothetical protein